MSGLYLLFPEESLIFSCFLKWIRLSFKNECHDNFSSTLIYDAPHSLRTDWKYYKENESVLIEKYFGKAKFFEKQKQMDQNNSGWNQII